MDINDLTEKIIGCAIEVHRVLGPGLLEAAYEAAVCIEFELTGLKYGRQLCYPATYKGRRVGDYRIDFIVENAVVVEIKSVHRLDPLFDAQILTYLRVTRREIGLLINFNERLLKFGIKRFVLTQT